MNATIHDNQLSIASGVIVSVQCYKYILHHGHDYHNDAWVSRSTIEKSSGGVASFGPYYMNLSADHGWTASVRDGQLQETGTISLSITLDSASIAPPAASQIYNLGGTPYQWSADPLFIVAPEYTQITLAPTPRGTAPHREVTVNWWAVTDSSPDDVTITVRSSGEGECTLSDSTGKGVVKHLIPGKPPKLEWDAPDDLDPGIHEGICTVSIGLS
ncbi:hypothetical protein [Tenebrionicola larvae]|jgi:hypothetical protein|nr:hypothetical protein [Tenebrionicola larvae]MBV5096270.1 hypothetical protein [Tenebrionicola larvae]